MRARSRGPRPPGAHRFVRPVLVLGLGRLLRLVSRMREIAVGKPRATRSPTILRPVWKADEVLAPRMIGGPDDRVCRDSAGRSEVPAARGSEDGSSPSRTAACSARAAAPSSPSRRCGRAAVRLEANRRTLRPRAWRRSRRTGAGCRGRPAPTRPWTMTPRPRGDILRSAASVPCTTPRYVTSVTRLNSLASISRIGEKHARHRVVDPDCRSDRTSPRGWRRPPRRGRHRRRPPGECRAAAASSTSRAAPTSPARPRASRPIEAPRRAKAHAVARPTPAEAP